MFSRRGNFGHPVAAPKSTQVLRTYCRLYIFPYFPRMKKSVFFPPLLLIVGTVAFSLIDGDAFLATISATNSWVLATFGWLFSLSTLVFLLLLLVVYLSPLGRVRIGGVDAVPLLNRRRWFAISICTTIATGILFWGCAEPLYHYASPPDGLGLTAASAGSQTFALSTLYLHWSFSPYGIYCVAGLAFALSYYNLKQPFRIGALLYPLQRRVPPRGQNEILDTLCLYALVLGMSASLGAGILSLNGGLEQLFGWPKSNWLIAGTGSLILICFTISAVSGLQKGIKILSSINITSFLLIAAYALLMGWPMDILPMAGEGLREYFGTFVQRSTTFGNDIDRAWLNDWSIFYWANWFAWAPVSSLFLGRIARGYTVREYIHFNLLLPSLFAILWMTIFSGSALHLNQLMDNALYTLMGTAGEEAVMYALMEQLPWGGLLSTFTLCIIFLSYVTAADSNISAMSAISSTTESIDGEAPYSIKIIWGLVIGALTYTMLSTEGINGIRILSVLGGLPALFIVLLAGASLARLVYSHVTPSGFVSR